MPSKPHKKTRVTEPAVTQLEQEVEKRTRELEELSSKLQEEVRDKQEAQGLLKAVVDATARHTGDAFFGSFARVLAQTFEIRYVLVCQHIDHPVTRVRTCAFWAKDRLLDNLEYDLEGGPCELTASGEWAFFGSGLQEKFPVNKDLVTMEAESYCGIPLRDSKDRVLGHIAIIDDRPMDFNLCETPALTAFIARAASELERQRNEKQIELQQHELAHVARMSTVGEMATGLAHELNQPLTAIANMSFYLREYHVEHSAPPDDFVETLNMLHDQAVRAGEIVRRIRSISQRKRAAPDRVDLNVVIEEALALMDSKVGGKNVEIYTDLSAGIGFCTVEPLQIQQVVINLVRNALDAIDELQSESRERIIRVTSETIDGKIAIIVSNSGPQIAEDAQARIFDAFFTTKYQSMGLGLSISRSIIEEHGGLLELVESSPFSTVFRFLLPRDKEGL